MNVFQAEEDPNAYSNLIFVVLGIGLLYAMLIVRERRYTKLKHIPASGHNRYILSCLDALRYLTDCPQILKKGYKDCYHRILKISTLHGWKILVADSYHIEELCRAPEEAVSLSAAVCDLRTEHHLFGHCRGGMTTKLMSEWSRCLTQNLNYILPGIREEIVASLDTSLATSAVEVKWQTASNEGWSRVKAASVIEESVQRVVNRAFFGPNVCECHAISLELDPVTKARKAACDELYSQLSATSIRDIHTFSIVTHIISFVPKAFSWLGPIFRPSAYRQRKMRTRLLTLVKSENENGRDPDVQQAYDQPHQFNLLSRLCEDERLKDSDQDVAALLVDSSVRSMQIISSILLQVLRRLAASCEDAESMRREINSIISREGWSGVHTLDKLRHVDSFVKETMRIDGLSALSTMRKTVNSFTFRDGTYMPPDTLLFSNAYARHHDASIYPAPGTFNGFRFCEMHKEYCGLHEGDCSCVRFSLTTTSPSFLAWGHGRHACPGRFFATAVMKMILAELLTRWDVRFEDGAPQQDDFWVGDACLPNREVEILVRARPL